LMLMGEHAVLQGQPCLVMAMDAYLELSLIPRNASVVQLDSDLGQVTWDLAALPETAEPFSFVLACLKSIRTPWPSGFQLRIRSGFSSEWGLGSSAAVVVGVLLALRLFTEPEASLDRGAVLNLARTVVRSVQGGVGSGADLAASLFGGVLHYRAEPEIRLRRLADTLPIWAVYSGYKEKTVRVIAGVRALRERHPTWVDAVFALMGQGVELASASIENQDWSALGTLLNGQQGLMSALGLSQAALDALLWAMRAQAGVFGAKISGSGLGDCLLALGPLPEHEDWIQDPQRRLPFGVSAEGAIWRSVA